MTAKHKPLLYIETSVFGAVNLREGYQVLRVKTPEEVLRYED